MDSYSAYPVEQARPDFGSSAADDGDERGSDDDIGREPPPASVGQDERRMQVRAYNLWASLLGQSPFPRIEDLAAAPTPDFADHAVVLDFSSDVADPAVRMLGAKLAEECGAVQTITRLSDVPGRSLLSRITDHYMQILANQAPIGFEAEFVNQRGKTVVYRGILLPFSSDGKDIQQIMGVINWKELADRATTAALLRELDHAQGAGHAPQPGAELAAWDDGPVAVEIGEQDAGPLPEPPLPDAQWALADWLASARASAEVASGAEDRSRAALYAAIGRAWDFALAAAADPPAFGEILAEAGLKPQARAPMTPVVKLVFGAGYDKTRLAEFAAALAHARRLGLERFELGAYLAATPGGLKRVVGEERRLRSAETYGCFAGPMAQDRLAGRLRALPGMALPDIRAEGAEFAVVLIRRLPGGTVRWLGEVSQDSGLIERIGRHLLG